MGGKGELPSLQALRRLALGLGERVNPMPADELHGFRIVPHTSEVALELQAADWSLFFEAAARGMLELYAPEPGPTAQETRRLELRADSAEELLVAWLNELNFWIATKRWIPARVRVLEAHATMLVAELSGSPLPEDGRLAREIKAATFGGLHVEPLSPSGWKATVILDV